MKLFVVLLLVGVACVFAEDEEPHTNAADPAETDEEKAEEPAEKEEIEILEPNSDPIMEWSAQYGGYPVEASIPAIAYPGLFPYNRPYGYPYRYYPYTYPYALQYAKAHNPEAYYKVHGFYP